MLLKHFQSNLFCTDDPWIQGNLFKFSAEEQLWTFIFFLSLKKSNDHSRVIFLTLIKRKIFSYEDANESLPSLSPSANSRSSVYDSGLGELKRPGQRCKRYTIQNTHIWVCSRFVHLGSPACTWNRFSLYSTPFTFTATERFCIQNWYSRSRLGKAALQRWNQTTLHSVKSFRSRVRVLGKQIRDRKRDRSSEAVSLFCRRKRTAEEW